MKNADLPAMPTLKCEVRADLPLHKTDCAGLTKREIFALHAPSCPDWYDSNESDTIRHIRWPVFYADLVLRELEK